MAADYAHIIGQTHQLVIDGLYQRCVVAGGQVGAAYAPVKQHIAGNKKLQRLMVEANTAIGMTGGVQHLKVLVAKGYDLFIFQETVGHYRGVDVKTKRSAIFYGTFQERKSAGMDHRLQPVLLINEIIAQDMVDMTMGVEQKNRFQLVFLNKQLQLPLLMAAIAGSINDGTLAGFIIQNTGIHLERVEWKDM